MGLDSVELVMRFEEEFSFRIPDSDAAQITTPGKMREYIVHELKARGEQPDEQTIWIKVRDIVVDQLGVKPEEVTRTARFVEDLKID